MAQIQKEVLHWNIGLTLRKLTIPVAAQFDNAVNTFYGSLWERNSFGVSLGSRGLIGNEHRSFDDTKRWLFRFLRSSLWPRGDHAPLRDGRVAPVNDTFCVEFQQPRNIGSSPARCRAGVGDADPTSRRRWARGFALDGTGHGAERITIIVLFVRSLNCWTPERDLKYFHQPSVQVPFWERCQAWPPCNLNEFHVWFPENQ